MNPQGLTQYLEQCRGQVAAAQACHLAGRLTRINGLVMEASGLKLPLGAAVHIQTPGAGLVEAEIVGFAGDRLFMMPAEDVYGLAPGALVLPQEPPPVAPVFGTGAPGIAPNTCRWVTNCWAGWWTATAGRSMISAPSLPATCIHWRAARSTPCSGNLSVTAWMSASAPSTAC